VSPATTIIGSGLTNTCALADAMAVQPVNSPCTPYTVVTVGEITILAVEAPLVHVNELTPVAVSVACLPAQIVADGKAMTGVTETTA
jgi:hypothetical protein